MRPAATLPVYRVPGTDYVLVDYGGLKGCRWRWELVPVNAIAWTPCRYASTDELEDKTVGATMGAALGVARAVDAGVAP